MKFGLPLTVAHFLDGTKPISRRGDSGVIMTLAGQGIGEPGNAVASQPRAADHADKPFAQTRNGLFQRPLQSERGAAQELRLEHKAKALFGGDLLGRIEPLQRQFRLTTIKVKHRLVLQGNCETKRMGNALAQFQCCDTERQTLLRITEQPAGLRAEISGTHARVMAAIKLAMEAVPFRIVDPASRLGMLVRSRRLAGKHTSRPGGVVRLQRQFVVRAVSSQLLQPVRQPAAVENPAGTVGRLPKAVDRHEQLVQIALLLGQFAGARIGLGGFGHVEIPWR